MPVRQIRIALIEDSRTVRVFYKNLFERAGFYVLEAEDAKKGWKIICDEKPDIIVLDMNMPEIPGIELLKRIRSFESSKNIPVMVLTSVNETEQVIVADGSAFRENMQAVMVAPDHLGCYHKGSESCMQFE